jgi:hypothetical protein
MEKSSNDKNQMSNQIQNPNVKTVLFSSVNLEPGTMEL